MRLRTRALLSVVGATTAVGLLAACQGDSTAQPTVTSAAPVTGLAAKVPDKVREDGALTIGIDPNYPPMVFLERGEAVGADLDIMSAVAGRLGLRPQFVEDAYALLVAGAAAGRFETAISALSVDDNDLQNASMVTYYESGSQLAVRPPAKKRYGQRNLCGRKVTVLDGSLQYSQLVERSANCTETKKKPIRIITFQTQAPATQAVINRKAYGTLADSPVIENAVIASNGQLVANGRPFLVTPYGIAVASERKQLAKAVRDALKSLMDDGTYQQILEQWGISEGGITDPEILTRKDIPEPTPLVPSPTVSPTPSPSFS
jgi:polar amino acid transport system substrate-binding protein